MCVACLTVFVNYVVKLFATCLGVVVLEFISVVGDDLLDAIGDHTEDAYSRASLITAL